MGFSVVDVSNRALQMLGALPIVSLTDGSKNARECQRCYNSLRQALLRSKPWNFATVFASLPAVTAPSNPPPINSLWSQTIVYNLPSDFLRLIAVSPFTGGWLQEGNSFQPAIDYITQNDQIITWASAPLNIRYLRDFQDVDSMDPIFREALSAYMAVEMCEMLTQSNTKAQAMSARFETVMNQAALINAFDKPAQETPDDTWISVRL